MRQNSRELYRKLASVARDQAGYFTASQALHAGYSYQAQRYHEKRGNWRRIDRGLYRFPEWPSAADGEFIRWTLWSRGEAVVSHASALALHDLGDFMPAKVQLTVPPGFSTRSDQVELHEQKLDPSDIEKREGYKATTPIRSILDVAREGADQDQLATAVGDLLDRGLATMTSLRRRAEEQSAETALAIERALQVVPA